MKLIKQGLTKQELKQGEIKSEIYRLEQQRDYIKRTNFNNFSNKKYFELLEVPFTCPNCDAKYLICNEDWDLQSDTEPSNCSYITCPNCGRRERADSGYLDIDISVFSYGVINNWKEEHEEQLMKEFEEQYTESEEELELYQQQEKKNQAFANMVQYAAGPVSKARLLNNGKKSFSTETAREM